MREIQLYLPEARFIHLIRDGRDVALSILKQSFGPETIEAAAERWRSRVLRGRAQQPYLGFYMEVKFEDLVLDTEGQLRRICEFIELDFDPAMLGYHETAEERLQEKARELPRGKGRDPQSAEKRLQSHVKTFEPPNPSLVGGYRTKMDDGGPRRLRGARRRSSDRPRLRGRVAERQRQRGAHAEGRTPAAAPPASHRQRGEADGEPARRRRRRGPPPGSVRGRRSALRHDAARGDARRASGHDDGSRAPLRGEAGREDALGADDRRARRQGDRRRQAPLRVRHRRGGAAAPLREPARAQGGPGDPRVLRDPGRASTAPPAGATRPRPT